MAIETGVVSTADMEAEALAVDMDPEMRMLDEDYSQFSTFTMSTRSKTTSREKFHWGQKDLFPRLAVVEGAYLVGATTVVVEAGQGAHILVGDVLRNMARGDAMWVTGVAGDTLTVVRNVGTKAAVAGVDGDTLLIMSNAHAQGADFPQTAVLLPTIAYNYTQIFRHGWSFANTAREVENMFNEPQEEGALKGVQHKRAIEYSGFWGARDMKTDPATGEPAGFTGGLVEFITTNKQDVGGSLTVDYLDTFFMDALQRSSGGNVVMYVSPLAALQISKFNRGGMGTAWRPSRENVAGLKVDAFMSGVYGYEIGVVVKKDWNDFPTTLDQYGGWVFIVDHSDIAWRPLRNRSTKLLTSRQNPGADRLSEEYLTEGGWQIGQESKHGILYGIV